jgi:hypothetical protein
MLTKHGEDIVSEPALVAKLKCELNACMLKRRKLQESRQPIGVSLEVGRELKQQRPKVAGARRRDRVEERSA